MRITTPTRRLLAAPAVLALGLTLAACGGDGDSEDAGGGAGDRVECESTVPEVENAVADSTPEEPTGEIRSFEADNGSVEIPTDPERIVATGYAVPVLLEAKADLVGISTWERGTDLMTDEDLATYEGLKKVAGDTADSTNYEAIAAVEPDLIILGVPLPVLGDVDVDRLEQIAPVVVLGPSRPDGWKRLSQLQTDAAGEQEYFEQARASYEEKAGELEEKYADVLDGYCFGGLGSYGDVSAGNYHREYAGSWGTNIAGDIGVRYYGAPKEPGEGSAAVSDYPSIEELPENLADATAITYTVEDDGTVPEAVQYVLDHELWQTLPAVQDGVVIPLPYTEAATYPTAETALDAIDEAFSEAFAEELE